MKRSIKLILVALFWLCVWEVLARLVGSPLLLPGPLLTARRLLELFVTLPFWQTVGVTMLRILCGTLSGILLGCALAVLTCRFALLHTLFAPLLTLIKSTPVVSFIILLLLWLGRDLLPAVIVILMVLPPVWANVCAGIRGTDKQLLEMAKVYRFPPSRTLRRIYIPSVLPHFLAACRSALGLAWKSGVAAEVLTVPNRSIGKALAESKLYMEIPDLFAWTATVVLCSLLIEKLLVAAIGRLGGGRP